MLNYTTPFPEWKSVKFFFVNSTTRRRFSDRFPTLLLELRHLHLMVNQCFCLSSDTFLVKYSTLSEKPSTVFPCLRHFSPSEDQHFKCRSMLDIRRVFHASDTSARRKADPSSVNKRQIFDGFCKFLVAL